MIESRSRPLRRAVAYRAILRQSRGYVVRVLRTVIRTQMAGYAVLRQSLIHSVQVAAGTGYRGMAPGQWKLRTRRVIESRSRPLRRIVAVVARL